MTVTDAWEIVKRFAGTKEGRKIRGAIEKEQLTKRHEHAKVIADTRARAEREIGPLTDRVNAALADRDEALRQFHAANDHFRHLWGERSSLSYTLAQKIAVAELALQASADPAIDAFIGEWRAFYHTELAVRPSIEWKRMYQSGLPVDVPARSDRPSRDRRVQYISDAIATAEALKLDAGADVEKALAALRDGLPATEMEPFREDYRSDLRRGEPLAAV